MALISSVAMWFSVNNGTIIINWLGWEIKTSVSIFLLVLISIIFVSIFFATVLIKILLLPKKIKGNIKKYKIIEAKKALQDGLIASTYGNTDLLNKKFKMSKNILGDTPLFLLFTLQNHLSKGNDLECFNTLTKMLDFKSTEPIAIKGLINLAKKNNDRELFVNMLNKSKEQKVSSEWIVQEALSFCVANGSWKLLASFLEKNISKKQSKLIRILGLIYLYISTDFIKKGMRDEAKKYAQMAFRISPTFPPTVELYCKLRLFKNNKDVLKKLKTYWYEFPHPNIVDCLKQALATSDKKIYIKNLSIIFEKSESFLKYLILGELKLNAKVYGEAKNDLMKSINLKPTKQAYQSLLRLEKLQSNRLMEIEKIKKLIPITEEELKWQCKICGFKQSSWDIYCQNCKQFDGLIWISNENFLQDKSMVSQKKSFSLRL